MRSLLVLTIAVFMVAVLPHIYADEAVSDSHRECVIKYLGCKDMCDYHDDAKIVVSCKAGCDRNFTCRPQKKKYKIPSLYE